jgi:hypothetical protein
MHERLNNSGVENFALADFSIGARTDAAAQIRKIKDFCPSPRGMVV